MLHLSRCHLHVKKIERCFQIHMDSSKKGSRDNFLQEITQRVNQGFKKTLKYNSDYIKEVAMTIKAI